LRKPVLDPKGDELGRVSDFVVVKGAPLPRVSALILIRKKEKLLLEWEDISIFNKRVISSKIYSTEIKPYESTEDDLLIVRDIFDKQIVDADGAKVVRVNDVKLEGHNYQAWLAAVDVGIRGILRRLGIERRSESIYKVFGKTLAQNLIRWGYIQPLEPRLTKISLTVPRQMISALHPADIAEMISNMPHDQGMALFKGLDPNVAAEALHELESNTQKAIIGSLDKEYATEIVERMPPDEAADLIGDLETETAKELLESIEKEEAQEIQELLAHEDDTAGGLMTTEFIACPPTLKVADAIEKFRVDAPSVETVYYIFVIDNDEKLLGITSLRDMLLSSPDIPMSDIMETKLKTVTPEVDQDDVAEMVSKYNLLAIPVVDEEGKILGIVTIDDIMDILLPASPRRKRRSV
jgi:CBS domain-containing protein/sporulation protein YlmC with PRC-barrel domain